MNQIVMSGAQIHNLKNLNLSIPKNQLVVITGISGSGKSSLAFDLLFEEGKNQYLNSIGILAGLSQEHRYDSLSGIGPTVAVCQNTVRQSNPRSTVGTKTGLLSQLALLYASDGKPVHGVTHMHSKGGKRHMDPGQFLYTTPDGMCLRCQGRGAYYDVDMNALLPDQSLTLGEVYGKLQITTGFLRLLQKKFGCCFQTAFCELPEEIREEVIYGNYESGKQSFCIERMLKNAMERGEDVEEFYVKTTCPECRGERVCEEAGDTVLGEKRIGELGLLTISSLLEYLNTLSVDFMSQFGKNILKTIQDKLSTLMKFRLGHLSLYREMSTLSGGEIQRVFLYSHLESKLDSLIYVFDEPLAGLHPSEKDNMIQAVKGLRDLGNTVIVVEHDIVMIREADHVIEIGPRAGKEGGTVVYQGNFEGYRSADSVLSRYLFGDDKMPIRETCHEKTDLNEVLQLARVNTHFLRDLTVRLPLHRLVGVAGVSGSGKSSLIEDTLLPRLKTVMRQGNVSREYLSGAEYLDGFVQISQEPIGRNSNSTPASFIGIWDKIRALYAQQEMAKKHHMAAGCFSFHSKGACATCGGSGYEKMFLTASFSVDKICSSCHGSRFNEECLSVTYRGKTVADVLAMSIEEAACFFAAESSIVRPLRILKEMGMGYLTLGQPTSSLSGGEAQRVKLAKELGKMHQGRILYVLDEPTTGLSMYDVALLLRLLDRLVQEGKSCIVIEHNIEILKKCDYILELGPGGGDQGGYLIAQGTPAELRQNSESITGKYLN